MAQGSFATVINCIDGRAKHPVANWMKLHLHVHYVDQITEPGPDKILTDGPQEQIEDIRRKVAISTTAHHSQIIAIAAHYDCAGNPVSETEHRRMVLRSADVVAGWGLASRVIGLWVTSDWNIEVLYDNGAQGEIALEYAAAITCVDGRSDQPVVDWMKQNFLVHYVDRITVPEPDRVLPDGPADEIELVRHHVEYCLRTHHPAILAIAAHHDCAGGAISADEHRQRLRNAVEVLKGWRTTMRIVGLWLNERGQVEIVADSAMGIPTVKLPVVS